MQPADPDPVGEHEVIHLGEHAAVVVPVEEYRVLRELKRNASHEALADAEDAAANRRSRSWSGSGPSVSAPEHGPEVLRLVMVSENLADYHPIIDASSPRRCSPIR